MRLAGVDSARDIASATRLLVGLPAFLRRRAVAQEAHAVIRRRLERRSATFLDLARRAILARPGSPYHRLMHLAGCGLGDLAHLVQHDGLEGALRALFRAGVYLRTDPTAPMVAINLSLGDQARMDERDCGCPYQQVGWTTHLTGIESFEKLNAGGMTFLDTDIVRILERDLPARFGGGPTDFQLVEQEREDGRPRVVLIVHPGVGAVDPAAVAEYLLDRLGHGSGAERIMALTWRQSGILEGERSVPRITAAGKLLPVLKVTGQPARPS